ncbi:MAG: putative prophage repressor [Verrucomicrobiales bacterium]|nr:putative prophage repressor [Verrucomicrobiales bacterium]
MTWFADMSEISERLTTARKRAGYEKAIDAANALGMRPSTYYSHENGSIGLRAQVAETYAKKFKVSLEWLLTGKGDAQMDGAVPYDIEVAGLPLLGSIQAGHWLELGYAQEEAKTEMVPIIRDQRFPHAKQYALRVVGDSMDLDYPDGSIVTCVDFADSGLSLGEGLIVHVERHRAAGQLIEVTLKAVERRKGKLCLVPHSSNPAWQPFPIDSQEGETTTIAKGIVLGGWSPQPLPRPTR